MKRVAWVMALAVFAAGCASTLEKRRREHAAVYAGLTPELRAAVDRGEVQLGMSPEAVYMAWGKPAQALTNETSQGRWVTWLYQGNRLKSYRYWTHQSYVGGGYVWSHPYLATSYYPMEYVSAEVIFQDNKVAEWRTLPAPVY
ncbi:MAG: hypothetical protein JXQ71_00700 [Verrucomicrobia bacterium]|nr:hypothetical protein [Verrucomicrobiota bacterium]